MQILLHLLTKEMTPDEDPCDSCKQAGVRRGAKWWEHTSHTHWRWTRFFLLCETENQWDRVPLTGHCEDQIR